MDKGSLTWRAKKSGRVRDFKILWQRNSRSVNTCDRVRRKTGGQRFGNLVGEEIVQSARLQGITKCKHL